jgi:hypothetical protein
MTKFVSNRVSLAWGALLAAVICAGCGPSGPDVVPVSGRITKGGRPVSIVAVQFYPEQGRPSSARTDNDGRYELEFSEDIPKGAVPGKHRVSIQVVQERIDQPINLKDPKYHPEMPEILKNFGDWQTTKLQVEVSHDQPVIDIELDSRRE